MDSNNVLSVTTNMEELDKDLYNWSLLPHKLRKISDDRCTELYGCKNRELYNKIKAKIMLDKPIDDNKLIDTKIQLSESYDYDSLERKDLIGKIGLAKAMNSDILTAIIYPYDPEMIDDSTYRDNYKEEFLDLYNKFLKLSDKYQKYSNMYSIQLFGYNVRSMYQMIYPDLVDDNIHSADISTGDILLYDRDYLDSSFSAVEETLTEDIVSKNVVELFKFKICNCKSSISEASTDGVFARTLINEVNDTLYTEEAENCVNSIVPYFTIDEYNSIINKDIDINDAIFESAIKDNRSYYKSITEWYNKFHSSKDDNEKKLYESYLLNVGWNPYVDPKNMSKVRERQVKWFKEHSCRVIDLSNYDSIESLTESTVQMEKMYKKMNLYPVYIVLSFTNTPFGKIIRAVKHSEFTHSGITLNSDLKQILTFKFTGKQEQGFTVESIDTYLNVYEDAKISVIALFVDGNTMKKLNDSLAYFISNKQKTKYNFKNLINVIRNKAKDNDPYNLSMICSQFVDTILKLADIELFDKSSNIVIPQDFENIEHPRVYKLYNGLAKHYNELKVEGKIHLLLSTSNPENIKYTAMVNKLQESSMNLFTTKYNIIDNDEANRYLQEFYDYISVKALSCRSVLNNKSIEEVNT